MIRIEHANVLNLAAAPAAPADIILMKQPSSKIPPKKGHESSSDAPKKRFPNESRIVRTIIAVGLSYISLRLGLAAFHRARRSMLRRLLVDISSTLRDIGVTHWVDFGCLLGIHRDGDLIVYDNDIDVVILDAAWDALFPVLKVKFPQYSVKSKPPCFLIKFAP